MSFRVLQAHTTTRNTYLLGYFDFNFSARVTAWNEKHSTHGRVLGNVVYGVSAGRNGLGKMSIFCFDRFLFFFGLEKTAAANVFPFAWKYRRSYGSDDGTRCRKTGARRCGKTDGFLSELVVRMPLGNPEPIVSGRHSTERGFFHVENRRRDARRSRHHNAPAVL